ncbi:MAG: hypothetical protein HKO84_00025 [Pseudomonadales bacterium]|nr:hypothetical protein [Pseudomonadales bacterium]
MFDAARLGATVFAAPDSPVTCCSIVGASSPWFTKMNGSPARLIAGYAILS